MSSSPLDVHLGQYDGPLDLLLDLIRKQQVNIYDIPIASITQQYLEYMQRALELDMALSAEFVYMAATLIHIKSRTLLPRDPTLQELIPEEDPRKELVDRLLEHERFKSAAEMLHQKRVVEEAVWSNPQIEQFRSSEEGDPGLAVTRDDYSLESYVLGTNHFQIELLANLDHVPEAGALVLVSFPKPEKGSGFPARVVAIVPRR